MRPSKAVLSTTPSTRTSSSRRSLRSIRLLPAVTVCPTRRCAARAPRSGPTTASVAPERDQREAGRRRVQPVRQDEGRADLDRPRASERGTRRALGERLGASSSGAFRSAADDLRERFRQLTARLAAGEVRLELGAQDRVQRAARGGRTAAPRPCGSPSSCPHDAPPASSWRRPSSRLASSSRARLMRLFTVPSGTSSDFAISSYGSPCRSHRMSGSRSSGGSARRPRWTSRARSSRSSPAIGCSSPGRRRLEHDRVFRPSRPLLAAAAVVVDRVVARHGQQPRAERPVRLPVLVERLVHLDEDLLRQVLGLVDPPGEAVGEAEHLASVACDELPPGGLVAGPAGRQEIGVGRGQEHLRHGLLPLPLRGTCPGSGRVHGSGPGGDSTGWFDARRRIVVESSTAIKCMSAKAL